MLKLEKYSIGTGDRFGKEAAAQLRAIMKGVERGADLALVWNKSYREHKIINTEPQSVRAAADKAVKELNWTGGYHVDADHINLETVGLFIDSSDFFTLDVADFTGKKADRKSINEFVDSCTAYLGPLNIPGLSPPPVITKEKLLNISEKYLLAVKEAGKIYRHIESVKGKGNFITEVSMDETEVPQTPEELFFILKAISDEKIPAQTIAPKFTGRFNKGVEYIGDLKKFDGEFGQDLLVIKKAVELFDLPENLKLSVHSGSDKFDLFPIIRRHIKKLDAGVHVKTAGTTWLEEIIGLAEAGESGLKMAKEIYRKSFSRYNELTAPYSTVIDIDMEQLPSPEAVENWSAEKYARTLRHDRMDPEYNLHFRQLLHVGYKIAAEMGDKFMEALELARETVERNVTYNILERHIKPLFLE